METSELLRLRLLSQQQALNAAISSLRAVTGATAAGAATCTEAHAPQEKAGDNDTSRTDGLVAAPNPSTPSTPATEITAAPTQKEFDDLKQALADGLKNVEDLQKQNAALKKELEKATASQEDDIPMKTSTNNEIFTVIYYIGGRLLFPLL